MKLFQIIILIYTLSLTGGVQWCERDIYEALFRTPTEEMDVLFIWFPVRAGIHSSAGICSNNTGLPLERHCSHNSQGINATWDIPDLGRVLFNCSAIGNGCIEEPFEHNYLMKNKVVQKKTNMWPMAKLGQLAKSEEPCLLESGLSLTRKCIFNSEHYNAEWEEKDLQNVTCLHDINEDIVTYDLNKLYKEVKETEVSNNNEKLSAATKLTNILAKPETVRIPADLEISTNILEILTLNDWEPSFLPKVLEVTNLLMSSDDNVVISSNKMDTPSTLIKTVDSYLDNMTNIMLPTSQCSNVPQGVLHNSQNFTSIFYINPACSNISGIAVYNSTVAPSPLMHYDSPTKTYYRYLYLNQTLEEIMNDPHLEVAAYFPETLWKALSNETDGRTDEGAILISLYNNNNFFADQSNNGRSPNSAVLKISIPDYKTDLPAEVPLIFKHRPVNAEHKPQCANWNYKSWFSSGVANVNSQNLVVCNTTQLTFFGALIGLNYERRLIANSVLLTVIVEFTLDIISIAGCGLSLFGLTWIWLTAAFCKQWRSQSSNKLLLNLCFVLTLIMGYFLFINVPALRKDIVNIENRMHCIAEGAFLQYTILVLFLWMLFIAILQYQRYVIVLGCERPRHFIAKYAVASWGLPIIPIALVVYLDSKSYMPLTKKALDINAICYPSGDSLYYALLLPISIIVLVNIGIFAYILGSIYRSLRQYKYILERKDIIRQVRLSILLFFLLGISWVFGILAHMDSSRVLSMLFCLTSTLQGFILFIYFVIIDQGAQYSWLNFCCCKAYYTMEDSSMAPLGSLNSFR